MPLYDYECGACHHQHERLAKVGELSLPCPECGATSFRQIGAPSFKIKGFRAESGYGGKFVDTPGVDADGKETGHSFTSNRTDGIARKTIDHNQG